MHHSTRGVEHFEGGVRCLEVFAHRKPVTAVSGDMEKKAEGVPHPSEITGHRDALGSRLDGGGGVTVSFSGLYFSVFL